MRLIDVGGTNSDSFSLGLGENKIELRTIDGVLYFRNFSGGWNRVSSESNRDAFIPREWGSGVEFSPGEVISYGGALWLTQERFVSTASFINNLDKVFKIKDVGTFTRHDISSSLEFLETSLSSDFIYVYGTRIDLTAANLFLPNATTLDVSRQFLIQNKSSNEVNIKNHDGELLGTIPSEAQASITLMGNTSTAGAWSYYFFSNAKSDSGGPSQIKVTALGGHTFAVGDVVTFNDSGEWQRALSTGDTFTIIGVIKEAKSTSFVVHLLGETELLGVSNLIPGEDYYLSESVPGGYSVSPGSYGYVLFRASGTNKILMLSSNDTVQYFSRKRVTLADGGSLGLLNVGFNFSFQSNDFTFEVNLEDDPTISFKGTFKRGTPPDVVVETTSTKVIDFEASGYVCLFISGNDLIIKNNLGSSKKFVFYRYI